MTFPFTYRGNLDWLQSNTLFLAKSGSHAYGTALPTSDIDYRGIAIPPIRYFFGFLDRFEEAIQEKDPDFCIYHILKFVDLAADNNANVMEVLYLPDDCVEFRTLNIEPLFEVRDEFLSKRCRYSFSGYAFAQLKRIQTHRDWLLKPLTRPPERADVGLTDVEPVEKHKLDAMKAAIQKEIDSWSVDVSNLPLSQRTKMLGHVRDMLAERISISETEQAGRRLGFNDDVIAHLEKHRKLAKLEKNWEQFLQWKANRNPARAELEAVYGYDTKHASHLLRLLQMCKEILEGKGVIVRRPNADELKAVRRGVYKLEEVLEQANKTEAEIKVLYETSTLKREPNRRKINETVIEIVDRFLVER